jgi:Concanavalin A-like lectin/glucanases superfamily/MBG domain/CARDB/PKD-like domain/Secretion system C-terminal sorting domain
MKKLFLLTYTLLLLLFVQGQTPVAYYPFTGNANDASGNALNGTVSGATLTTDRFGVPNSAYSFNGINDFISTSSLATTQTTNWTLSAWVSPASLTNADRIIVQNGGDGPGASCTGYALGIHNNTIYGYHPCVVNIQGLSTFSATNQWYHVAMVNNGSGTQFYINGVLASGSSNTRPIIPNGVVTIGSATGIRFFQGAIDEVKIYNTTLTAAQVQNEFGSTSTGLVAYYPFTGNANDAAGTNNGTVNGAVLTTDRFGNANSAYSFDGVDDRIDLGSSFNQQNFTIGMWVKPGATQVQYADIIDNNHSGSFTNWTCQQDNTNVNNYGFGLNNTGTAFALVANQWQYLTLIKSPTTIETYINGVLVQSTPYSGGPVNYSGNFLRLGSWGGGGRNWNGVMDEVKIFDKALTPAEVQQQFQSVGQEFKPGSGNAISFDGVDDNITTPAYLIPTTGDFTVDFWVFNRSNTGFREFISQGASGDAFYIGINNAGTGEMRGGDNWINTGAVLPLNKWTHVAFTKAGTNATIFLNGIQAATQTGYTISAAGTQTLFGRQYGGLAEYPNASMDEVRIWNTALTQAQIRDRMCKKITNTDPLYSNLAAYYNFDETTGNSIADGTLNGNGGTLVNGPTRMASGAAIGDNSSHNYVTTGLPLANLSTNGQDNLEVAYTAGTYTGTAGTHIYVVNEKPNTVNGITGVGTNDRYFGVFNANLSSPTYTATYNYTGNPYVTPLNETKLALFKRNNGEGTTWSNGTSTLNISANTLIATGQNTEYMLGEGTSTVTTGGNAANIVAAEYFIDTDPGVGGGTAIPVTTGEIANFTATIPAGTLPGFHFLAIRTKDSTGQWGLYENRGFFVGTGNTSDAADIVAAEYFIDTDPGAGLGAPITVNNGVVVNFTASIPAGTVPGFHVLAIRTKDSDGKWGMYENCGFFVSNAADADAADIVAAEYFIDTDPGPGLGSPISVTNGAIVNFTANVPAGTVPGFHFIAIRTKDATGKWGLFENRGFFVNNTIDADAADIVAAEYFIDADPGTGNGSPIPVTNGAIVNFTANVPAGTVSGFHFLAIRTKDANGKWGMYENRGFFVNNASTDAANIVAAEYFLDQDPGPGNGIPITVPTPGANINETFSLPLDFNLPQGHHEFALRVKDADGKWGLFAKDTFYIPFVTVPKVFIGTVPTNFCAGASVNIPFTTNIDFGLVNVFTAQLSNAAGSFASPVNIGSISTDTSGTIAGTIPSNTPVGSNYRIRIVATEPKDTSNNNVGAITIGRVPEVGYTITGITPTCAGNQTYTVSTTEPGVTYTWSVSGGGTITPNGASATINWTTAGLHTISVFATNSCGNGTAKTLDVRVFETAPTLIPAITVNNRTLTATAATIAQGVLAYIWFKDGVVIAGQTGQSYNVPNTDSGSYTVAYMNTCGTGSQSLPVNISYAKNDQTITFDAVAPKVFGDAPFVVNAIATSGLPVTYSLLSGPATLSGTTVTITGAGTIVVQALQAGNNQYNPAFANLSVIVTQAAASIVLSNLTQTYDGNGKAAVATTNPLGLNNSITYNGSGSLPVNAGSYNVSASITSPNYLGSTTGVLTIGKANQTLSINPIADRSYNSVPFNVTASATSGLPVVLTIVTVPATGVASISGNQIILLGAGGTVTVFANQPGNMNYNPAVEVSTAFTVTPPLTNDIQMVSLLSPVGGCSLGASSNITVRLKNLGTAPATGFNVSYQINGGTVVTEPITATIAPGQPFDYTFGSPANFVNTNATYSITAYTALTTDGRLSNDTITKDVIRFAPPVTGVSADTAICLGGTATLRAFGGSVYNWTGGPATATYTVSPIVTTTYQVAILDANGCTTSNYSVTVTVNANPVADAGSDVSILRGSSTTLTATGGGTYLWSSNAGTTASVDVSPVNTTNYTVTVRNAAGCTASDNVLVTVNFSALSVSPSIVDFGGVVKDSVKTATVTITNNGTLTETINSITNLLAPFTTTLSAPQTLAPGASVTMNIRFSPTATLFYNNVFTMATSVGNFNITLKGVGVAAAPAWSVTPANYNYDKVPINTFVNKDFILRNTGNISIKISSVSSSNTRFVGTVNGITDLPVGGTVILTIRFNPIAITTYDGTITVRTSTPNLAIIKPIVTGKGYIPGPLPQLQYVSTTPYNDTSGVSPYVGPPGVFTYSVIYKHPGGLAPFAGFPKAGIDKNADGDFADAGESLTAMTKVTPGTNWAAGVVFTLVTSLPISNNYGYQFFATDANGNDALPNTYKEGPLVTPQALDLHIFASDITFSIPNPAVNQDFQVNATVHNNSPYSAQDVNVRFYYKDSIYMFSDTIPLIDANSEVTLTHTLKFSPDGFYPIKVWIDSTQKLPEYNLLNNYASRPVIIGVFTVPGTIDVTNNAAPDGCSKGKVIYSGTAKYRGLNLDGTPPVEGATVTIRVLNYGGGVRTITTHTDNNGNYYLYDDPCAQDPFPDECKGYQCDTIYNYTVEVTDFTLTSPAVSGTVFRPCTNCNPDGVIDYTSGIGCVLPNEPFNYGVAIANYSFDIFGNKRCAPTTYNDTITIYQNGVLAYTYTRDSIARCADVGYTSSFAGLPIGNSTYSFTHSYYTATGDRKEFSQTTTLNIPAPQFDLAWDGSFNKTGLRSFSFTERNLFGCGVIPGGFHKVYLYDSLPGYVEKVLIDSFMVDTIGNTLSTFRRSFSYGNPNWEVGCHYLTAITDVGNNLSELNENNNVLEGTFCIPFPDISVKNIKFSSSSVTTGSLINFSAKFKNEGTDIVVPFKVAFRANNVLVGTKISIPAMLAGEEIEIISAPFQVPTNPCPITVIAYGDDENVITEARENNNTDTAQFGININAGRSCAADTDEETVGAGFFSLDDPLSVCFAYEAPKGFQTYFATTVRNTGTRDATNIKVRFTLFGNVIGTDVIPSLKAGKKVESGFFYTFDTVGRFIISAFADYTKEICEINEADNIGRIHVDTKPVFPDLQILSQHIAPSNLNPNPGQQITIVSSILNIGTGPSRPTKVRFWVNDVPLGDDIGIDSIYPGLDTTVMATVPYSSSIVGLKVVKVKADVSEIISERNEGNNEATRGVIVGAAPDFANSIHEAITLNPGAFAIGDTITICNYLRNYGGETGTAWLRFSYIGPDFVTQVIDSVQFTLASNDSMRVCLRWKVSIQNGTIVTEILHSVPPEFDEENNRDTLNFNSVLPLTLLSFNGNKLGNDINLEWRTTDEVNLWMYEIERSSNGRTFEKIGSVNALNRSGTHKYATIDYNPWASAGTQIYYRLKMIDKDGIFRYSKIVSFSNSLFTGMHVSPNPTSNMLNVQLQVNKGSHLIKIMDVAGKTWSAAKYDLIAGNQIIKLNVSSLASGAYIITVQHPDGKTDRVNFIKAN